MIRQFLSRYALVLSLGLSLPAVSAFLQTPVHAQRVRIAEPPIHRNTERVAPNTGFERLTPDSGIGHFTPDSGTTDPALHWLDRVVEPERRTLSEPAITRSRRAGEALRGAEALRGGATLIVNNGGYDLHFSVRSAGGDWNDYTVRAGESMPVACNPCTFSMSTNDRELSYTLDPGKRYSLKWDTDKQLWNLFQSRHYYVGVDH